MPKPRMRGRPKPKPTITRIKTVWVTEKSEPFESDFAVGPQIGEAGQFGKAYRCQRKQDQKSFAVKAISKARFYRLDKDPKKRQALLFTMKGEIDVMRRLQHKFIVGLDSVYEDKHTLYIVMEECKGGELFDRIRARGNFNEKDASKVTKMILEALYHMHEIHRVVHCDLKPDNILFVNDRDDSPIKIIDFGMSKVLPRLRTLQELCGTPYYTAPEIIQGEYAHEADMWSVGVILFVMLFGFPPFYVDPSRYYGRAEAQAIYKLIARGFTPKVKKGYGAWFPAKMPISDEAMDLIGRLIESDRARRLNAREALQHPWITGGQKRKPAMTKELFAEFAKFNNNCNFKLAVIQIFREQFEAMRPQHFQELKGVFKTMDTDGSGEITFDDFEKGMMSMDGVSLSQDQIREMFKELDVKEVGKIGFEELLNAAVHDYLVSGDERLYQAFRELDTNDDGVTKTDELKARLAQADPYGEHANFLKIIDDADLDKNGEIDYEEFLRALHPDFNEIPHWFWTVQQGGGGDGGDADDQKDPEDPASAA